MITTANGMFLLRVAYEYKHETWVCQIYIHDEVHEGNEAKLAHCCLMQAMIQGNEDHNVADFYLTV